VPKQGELDYVANMARLLNVDRAEVERSLLHKPYPYARRGFYLMDLGQIFRLLPEPPVRLLDVGCGSGWTSKMFALAGHEVVGLDVCADMIDLARRNCDGLNAAFFVQDYEESIDHGRFDCAVIYDALHHAIDERRLIQSLYTALKPGGTLITAEPGQGHADSEETLREAARWGTTEKDMPFSHQRQLMLAAGFLDVAQYARLSELPLVRIDESPAEQQLNVSALLTNTVSHGFTSIAVARR
jgi:2-polyprenyl-3-methyl-5-hydroxy-6-metoxy-1,4-benzoquinol methylase